MTLTKQKNQTTLSSASTVASMHSYSTATVATGKTALTVPRFPRPAVSLVQFFLSTVPILILFIYFLISAKARPKLDIYNLTLYMNDDSVRQGIIQNYRTNILADGLMDLSDMLYVFNVAYMMWVALFIYLIYFIPQRRKLMLRYVNKTPISATQYFAQRQQQQQQSQSRFNISTDQKNEKDHENENENDNEKEEDSCPISLLGNVAYYPPTSFFARFFGRCYNADYAVVTYEYPEDLLVSSSQGHHEEDDSEKNGNRSNGTKLMVEKRIRTYHPYHREKVTILLLSPHLPLSGLPLADIQRDVATFTSTLESNDPLNLNLPRNPRTPTKAGALLLKKSKRSTPPPHDSYHRMDTKNQDKNQINPAYKDHVAHLLLVTLLWIAFTFIGSFYILHQIHVLYSQVKLQQEELSQFYYNQKYNDDQNNKHIGQYIFDLEHDLDMNYYYCRKICFILMFGITPFVSVGGNILAWWNYSHWITSRGKITAHVSVDAYIPQVVTREELHDDGTDALCDRYHGIT